MKYYTSNSFNDLVTFLSTLSEIPKMDRVAATSLAGAVISLGCPSLLKIPSEMLLLHNTERKGSWSVVKNATSALVMRLDDEDALKALFSSDYVSEFDKENFSRLCDKNDVTFTFPCYLKVKNKLGTHDPKNVDFTEYLKHNRGNLGEIYIGHFFSSAGGIFIFMNDMGNPVTDESFLKKISSFANFSPLFFDLVERIMLLVDKRLYHGDIHLWNVVVDTKEVKEEREDEMKLHLIDYDEAKKYKIDIRKPTAKNDRHKRRYVQSLLQHEEYEAYTKNQIVNLFCESWELFMKKETNHEVENTVNGFMGKYYGHFNKNKMISVDKVNEFYKEMMTFLQKHASIEKSISKDAKSAA